MKPYRPSHALLKKEKRKNNDGLKKIIQPVLHLSNVTVVSYFTLKKKNDCLIENYFKQCFIFLT